MRRQIGADTGEIGSRFFNILLHDRYRDILLLYDAVGVGCFVAEHIVIFFAIYGQAVIPFGHQDICLELVSVELAVIDRQLGGCAAVKAVEKLRIREEHGFLILAACDKIIDVLKLKGFGKTGTDLEDTVRVNTVDRDIVMDGFGDLIGFLILTQDVFQRFHHFVFLPSFLVGFCVISW